MHLLKAVWSRQVSLVAMKTKSRSWLNMEDYLFIMYWASNIHSPVRSFGEGRGASRHWRTWHTSRSTEISDSSAGSTPRRDQARSEIMGVGRGGGRGGQGHLDIKIFSKKVWFLSFEWEKKNFTTFGSPLEKFWKNPLAAHTWKRSLRRPCRRRSHSIWSLGELLAAFSWVQPAGLASPMFPGTF